MELEGLHHITMITADAQATVDFYADTLGLRLVKQTVNFDQPDAYHLYFGDETGAAGSILTWFELGGARDGRAGDGMVHRIELGVPSAASLDFWAQRLDASGVTSARDGDALRFADPEGLALALVPATNPPLQAAHPQIPHAHAITGVEGARAYATRVAHDLLVDTLGFRPDGEQAYVLAGPRRRVRWAYDSSPGRGVPGAGTVHHIAFAARDDDQLAWRERVRAAGAHVTEVRDRDYFRSVYFREPSGVLFELATLAPGFAVDEDPRHLGQTLRLPRQHEHLRPTLERTLRPLRNPRA